MRPPARSKLRPNSKPANAPPGSAAPELGANTELSSSPLVPERVGRHRGRRSECEPWRDLIQAKCDLGLSAQRIYQDLITEHSFTGELLQRPPLRPPVGAEDANCHSDASNAGQVTRLRSTSAKAPGSLVPTASAARPISSASCCPTRARHTARLSTARPPTTFSDPRECLSPVWRSTEAVGHR